MYAQTSFRDCFYYMLKLHKLQHFLPDLANSGIFSSGCLWFCIVCFQYHYWLHMATIWQVCQVNHDCSCLSVINLGFLLQRVHSLTHKLLTVQTFSDIRNEGTLQCNKQSHFIHMNSKYEQICNSGSTLCIIN